MKNSIILTRKSISVLFVSILLIKPAFCNQPVAPSPAKADANLKYTYPADKSVRYLNTGNVIQKMDIEGQEMQTIVKTSLGCSVKSAGTSDQNLKLEISIDEMSQNIESQGGNYGGPITDISGKVFTISLTNKGKETDLSEAKAITYNPSSGGATDLSASFSDFFPDLPSADVIPGDTWNAYDSLNIITESSSMNTKTKFEAKYEGNEIIEGVECAKISYNLSGTQTIFTESEGYDVKVIGPFTGTAVLFFSPELHYFIRYSSTINMKGNVEVLGMDMIIPIDMEITSETKVVN
ncbi:MAG: hypothetical protein JXN62_04480 [Bacteroidales bacterium]|nr:hypothetical protein [Bacteroidales bacterium]